MDCQGRIWIQGDDPDTALEAVVTVDAGQLSIASKTESLGSWQLSDVHVERQGDLDFTLSIGSDRLVFRPDSPAGASSFARELGMTSSLAGKIRASASTPPPASQVVGPAITKAGGKTLRERWTGVPTFGKIAVGVVVLIVLIAALTSGNDEGPQVTAAAGTTVTGAGTATTAKPVTTTTAAATTTRPTTTTTAPPTTQFTRSEENAIASARSYLDYTAFSRKGLIEQLEYEGFSTADATLAVDYLNVDWFEQAWLSAESYLDYTAFSRSGLIDQLLYEGFTQEQATYGVDKTGL